MNDIIPPLPLRDVSKLARGVGIDLAPNARGQLYVWVDPFDHPVYVGKNEPADGRTRREEGWSADSKLTEGQPIGLSALIRRHRARPKVLEFHERRDAVEAAVGGTVNFTQLEARLSSAAPLEAKEIEEFMIRLMVHLGEPIGNSHLAGQWESAWVRPMDQLATVASWPWWEQHAA